MNKMVILRIFFIVYRVGKKLMENLCIPAKALVAFCIVIVPDAYGQLLRDGGWDDTLIPYNITHNITYTQVWRL